MELNTISKQLLFSTVRITTQSTGTVGTGTGFIVRFQRNDGTDMDVLVTNHHVIEGQDLATFAFLEGLPSPGGPPVPKRFMELKHPENSFRKHPTLDLAAIPLSNLLGDYANTIRYAYAPESSVPTDEQLLGLDALEEITYVGYPNGWFDVVSGLPVFRRGITASPLHLDFAGQPQFLVDASTFGGSSGSPVFIYNSGVYADALGNIATGPRVILVGVLSATIDLSNIIPGSAFIPNAGNDQAMDLGVVINWRGLRELLDLFR